MQNAVILRYMPTYFVHSDCEILGLHVAVIPFQSYVQWNQKVYSTNNPFVTVIFTIVWHLNHWYSVGKSMNVE